MYKLLQEAFQSYAKLTGIEDHIVEITSFVIILVSIATSILLSLYKVARLLINFYWTRKNNKDLHPFFTHSDVRKASKYFIQTKFQNISPTEDEEPNRKYLASAKNKLMPLFLENVFPYGKTDNKFYLILADSGMGKTTFLLNLYIKYKNRSKTFLSNNTYDIKLIPIWHQDSFRYIEKIEKPENTILLLDAFDESFDAQKNYFLALKHLITKTSDFRIIVLSCRTQFFPNQKEEPYETGYFTAGERGEFFFQKLYLSPFDDKDIRRYLKKRFPHIWQRKKYLNALGIAKKCPNLLIRPMLLNHIEDLLDQDVKFNYSFQVYDALINSWIRRESKKIGIKEKYQTERRFIRLLKAFSEKLSINLYENSEKRKGYYIPKDEGFAEGILNINDFDDIEENQLDEKDGKGKSLLTRNAVGDYKFSHKSILEFFLAKAIFDKHLSYSDFRFTGMDLTKSFHTEMMVNKLKSMKGHFSLKDQSFNQVNFIQLSNFKSSFISNISTLVVKDVGSIALDQFSIFKNAKKLILIDELIMKDVYIIYAKARLYFNFLADQIKNQRIPKEEKQIWQNSFSILESKNLNALKIHLQNLNLEKLNELSKYINLDGSLSIDKIDDLKKEIFLIDFDNINNLQKANNLIAEGLLLQKLNPTNKVYF